MTKVFNLLKGTLEDRSVPKNGEAGPIGPKGDKGDIGMTGPIGPQGERGDRGDTGRTGMHGDKGDRGEAGPIGPKGDKGDRGEIGPVGPEGLKGETTFVGNKIFHTILEPEANLGDDGDFCFCEKGKIFYKVKNEWKLFRDLSAPRMMGGGISRVRKIENIGNVKLSNLLIGDKLVFNGSYWTNESEATSVDYKTNIDKVSESITYIGYAEAGVATSAALWKIKRLTTTGDDLSVEFADGDILFDNIWDNRASLSYS